MNFYHFFFLMNFSHFFYCLQSLAIFCNSDSFLDVWKFWWFLANVISRILQCVRWARIAKSHFDTLYSVVIAIKKIFSLVFVEMNALFWQSLKNIGSGLLHCWEQKYYDFQNVNMTFRWRCWDHQRKKHWQCFKNKMNMDSSLFADLSSFSSPLEQVFGHVPKGHDKALRQVNFCHSTVSK